MFKILITDDDYEDRELLKMEIKQALGNMEPDLRFWEAVSVRRAKKLLSSQFFDLMTLDIQFDRMSEGIDALPEIFESFPTLNIIIVSGRLNKREVSEKLFGFTKDNVLKGKRWTRHFDVLDKKDSKTEALQNAYSFALKNKEAAGELQELFLTAESFMEKGMIDKCFEIYHKIQSLSPGEHESKENICIFKQDVSIQHVREYIKRGDNVVASLLLGHYLETQLKAFTAKTLGRAFSSLSDCLTGLKCSYSINELQIGLFLEMMRLRNKAIHNPTNIVKNDFDNAENTLKLLNRDYR